MTDTLNFTDTIVDNWDIESLDDDKYRHDQHGNENHRFNMGDKYGLGGVLDQLAYTLDKKKKYLDTVEARQQQEHDTNGTESALAHRLSSDVRKAEAAFNNYQMLFVGFVDLYEAITQDIWCDGEFHEDYGRAWFVEEKERMATPKNEYQAPTKKEMQRRREMMQQRLRDRQTRTAVAG